MQRASMLMALVVMACAENQSHSTDGVVLDSSIIQLEMLRDSAPTLYPAFRTLYVVSAQTSLARLGFGPDELSGTLDSKTKAATRRFEASRQLPVTGNPFAAATFARLNADVARIQRAEAYTVHKRWFDSYGWSQGVVSAEGPWVADGIDNPAAARIRCDRVEHECIIAEAEYGEEQLVPVIDRYTIELWDEVEIRTRPEDAGCQRTVLHLNRIDSTVTLVRTTLSRTGVLCGALASDSSVAYNRTSRLATEADIKAQQARHERALFDSLLNVSVEVRRALAVLRDTAALRRALAPRPSPANRR